MKFLLIFSSVLIACHAQENDVIDLEDMAQDLVIETKRIDISEYPNAFNPSIIRWNGSLLLSFREIPNPLTPFESNIGLIWLDEDFNPVGSPQILDTSGEDFTIPSRAEDARLVKVGEKLYIVFSNNRDKVITRGGFRVYISELEFKNGTFSLHNLECLSTFEDESKDKREKNWVPFDYDNILLLSYSLSPHRILRPLFTDGKCETFASTQETIPWDWGDLRGGTPGLLNENEYIAFFHSSKYMPTAQSEGKNMTHYFTGAYTFASQPPFEITKISPMPIIGKGFYTGKNYKPYWKPVRVVFPGGFIFNDNYIWLAYGKQDHEMWIVKLDKNKLIKSLIPTQ